METDSLRITLDALRTEGADIERRVRSLQAELEQHQQRLVHIRGAIQNLQFILGEPDDARPRFDVTVFAPTAKWSQGRSLADSTLRTFGDALVADLIPAEHAVEELAPTEILEKVEPPAGSGIKRTKSTDLVIEIIEPSGRIWTRDEVIDEYEQRYGFPESWVNPRNSVGNALTRAVSKGALRRFPGDQFASITFDLFAEPQGLAGSGQLNTRGHQ